MLPNRGAMPLHWDDPGPKLLSMKSQNRVVSPGALGGTIVAAFASRARWRIAARVGAYP